MYGRIRHMAKGLWTFKHDTYIWVWHKLVSRHLRMPLYDVALQFHFTGAKTGVS